MDGSKQKKINEFRLRAALPKVFGAAAVLLLLAGAVAIGISFYRASNRAEFRMKNFPASLSKDVVATVTGYERREMDGERTKYFIRADKAISYADNHQELENVFLEVFSEDGSASDRISAQKAVYVPAAEKNFTAYFAGSVNVETRDQLKVKTEQLTYKKETETAVADEVVEFERLNIRGRSLGAVVLVREKTLELQKDVEINGQNPGETSKLIAGSAVYDQQNEKIELRDGVSIELNSEGHSGTPQRFSSLAAGRVIAYLTGPPSENRSLERAELFESVRIQTREGDSAPTAIFSGYAHYQKAADRFDLRDSVRITTTPGEKPTEIRSDTAVYEQAQGKITLNGNASIVQTDTSVQGNVIYAELDRNKKVKLAEVRDGAIVKQSSPERTTEVTGAHVRALFNDGQVMTQAIVTGSGQAKLIPAEQGQYTKLSLAAQRSINVQMKGEGLLDRIVTEGRTNVRMDVPNNSADSSNKTLAADAVTTQFAQDGKSLVNAVATGNAELFVEPLSAGESNYKTTINAPKFDCEFFPTGNDPKRCTASTKTKTVRVPTQPAADRGTQTIISDRLNAEFNPQTKALENLAASGGAKFTELDRNATADTIAFTSSDQTVRLRGGDPVVWDGQARAKAPEIDWDSRNQISELRGGASTTYYSPASTSGTTPFGRSKKPVYVTAQNARFDHRTQVAVFTGNARGWQDSNYVRGERLTISERDGRFTAEDNVQSLLYEAKRKENGVESNQPVFVSAQKMTYTRDSRLMRYENNVDIRQGKDRITGGIANIFLTENNEPSRTEIERNVLVSQVNRKAAADFVRYDTAGEVIFLRGTPATVEDSEQGRSQASEITLNLKENKYTSEGPSKQNSSGRIRSVYKIKNQ